MSDAHARALPYARVLGRLQKNSKMITGGGLLVVVVFLAIAGPALWRVDPTEQALRSRLSEPTWDFTRPFPLGTDHLGRDILAGIIWGARISLLVGLSSLALAMVIGVTLGLISGYYGGWLDFAITKVVEFVSALPPTLVAIALMAFIGQGIANLVAILGFTRWVGFCRQVRAEILSLRDRDYVTAARSLGASDSRIMLRHLFTNTVPSIVVLATFSLASMIVAEASLSFLGVGVSPDTPTWGSMLNEAREFVTRAWWMSVLPGGCIFVTVLSVNLLGDALRDWIDPKLRRQGV